jgi:hypothetical protein
MKKAKHTRGPWLERDGYEIVAQDGSTIAHLKATEEDRGRGLDREANSRLICSAPDMYETMVEAVKVGARWAADEGAASEVALQEIVGMLIATLEFAQHKTVAVRTVLPLKAACPRCEQNTMHPKEEMNALSRRDNETYICSSCGMAEAMEDFFISRTNNA